MFGGKLDEGESGENALHLPLLENEEERDLTHEHIDDGIILNYYGPDGEGFGNQLWSAFRDDFDVEDDPHGYTSFNDILSIQSADRSTGRGPTPNQKKTVRVSKLAQRRLKQCANLLALVTIALVIIVIPVLTFEAIQTQSEERGQVTLDTLFYSSAVFVLLACSLSIYEICCHLTHWYMPDVQKYVVRILWMVPIYSVDAWCSIRFHHFMAVVLEMIRGLYEAHVICSFVYYLVELLGGEQHAADVLRNRDPSYGRHYIPSWLQRLFDRNNQQINNANDDEYQMDNTDVNQLTVPLDPNQIRPAETPGVTPSETIGVHPFCIKVKTFLKISQMHGLRKLEKMLQPWSMGEEFLYKTKYGVLQYVVLKVVSTVAVVIMNLTGLYNSDHESGQVRRGYLQSLERAQILNSVIMNLSVGMALYCLVKIYYATKEDLTHPKNWHPAYKFLCVKGVVFFTFWQGVLLALLNGLGCIPSWGPTVPSGEVTNCIQNYIVCLEMLLFAIAHRFTFSYKEYLPQKYHRRRHRRKRVQENDENQQVAEAFFPGAFDRISYLIQPQYDKIDVEHGSEKELPEEKTHENEAKATAPWSFSFFPDLLSPKPHMDKNKNALFILLEEEEESDSLSQSVGCSSCESEGSCPVPPQAVRQLFAPMSARRALWSSVIPEETLSDIRRFSHGTKSVVAVALASRQEPAKQPEETTDKEIETQSQNQTCQTQNGLDHTEMVPESATMPMQI